LKVQDRFAGEIFGTLYVLRERIDCRRTRDIDPFFPDWFARDGTNALRIFGDGKGKAASMSSDG
jgi:hypothetical protein